MRVWVTRDEPPNGALSTALRDAGLCDVLEPVIRRRLLGGATCALEQLGPDDWLVLTSVFAVESVPISSACVPRTAVVGESSAQVARQRGLRVELVSPARTAASLFDILRGMTDTGKVCYPRSSLAKAPEAWADVELTSPVLYETVPREFDRGIIDRVDVVAVASPSAVRAVSDVELPFASIGPTTSRAIVKIGKTPWVEAPDQTFVSLAAAIAAHAR